MDLVTETAHRLLVTRSLASVRHRVTFGTVTRGSIVETGAYPEFPLAAARFQYSKRLQLAINDLWMSRRKHKEVND